MAVRYIVVNCVGCGRDVRVSTVSRKAGRYCRRCIGHTPIQHSGFYCPPDERPSMCDSDSGYHDGDTFLQAPYRHAIMPDQSQQLMDQAIELRLAVHRDYWAGHEIAHIALRFNCKPADIRRCLNGGPLSE